MYLIESLDEIGAVVVEVGCGGSVRERGKEKGRYVVPNDKRYPDIESSRSSEMDFFVLKRRLIHCLVSNGHY